MTFANGECIMVEGENRKGQNMIKYYIDLVTRLQKEQMELYKIYYGLKFYQKAHKEKIMKIIEKYDDALMRNYKTIEEIISSETK